MKAGCRTEYDSDGYDSDGNVSDGYVSDGNVSDGYDSDGNVSFKLIRN